MDVCRFCCSQFCQPAPQLNNLTDAGHRPFSRSCSFVILFVVGRRGACSFAIVRSIQVGKSRKQPDNQEAKALLLPSWVLLLWMEKWKESQPCLRAWILDSLLPRSHQTELEPETWREKMIGFGSCFVLGYLMSFGSFFCLKDLIVANSRK